MIRLTGSYEHLKEYTKGLKIPKGVYYVDTPEKLEMVERVLSNSSVIALDTEGYGCKLGDEHPIYKSQPISVQFGVNEVGWDRVFVPLWDEHESNLSHLRSVFRSPHKTWLLHNAKHDLHTLANRGIHVGGAVHDTLPMDYLAHSEERSHGLKECIERYFDETAPDFNETFKENIPKKNGEPSKRFRVPPLTEVIRKPGGIEKLIAYGSKDTEYELRLYNRLETDLRAMEWTKRGSMWDYFLTFDAPFTQVLYRIERRGMVLDRKLLEERKSMADEKALALEVELREKLLEAGVPHEVVYKDKMLTSPQQLGNIFVNYLNATLKETAKGKASTNEESLSLVRVQNHGTVAAEVASLLLELRSVQKLSGTYLESYLDGIDFYKGKVHTTLSQTGTATMRLSSSNKNLQNVPTPENDEFGIRECFVAPEGMEFGDIDLNQIELRMQAHFSQDPVLTKVLKDDIDMHSLTLTKINARVAAFVGAREVTKEVLAEVKEKFKKERRDEGKVINFGVGYGMGPLGYAAKVGCSEAQGKNAIRAFFELYSVLYGSIERTKRQAHQYGHIRTLLRRYVAIPNINSPVPKFRGAAERKAWNYKIQGSVADFIKMAMILIDQDAKLASIGAYMVGQVHDELPMYSPKGARDEVRPIVDDYVSHAHRHFGLKDLYVETPGELNFGPNWAEAKLAIVLSVRGVTLRA